MAKVDREFERAHNFGISRGRREDNFVFIHLSFEHLNKFRRIFGQLGVNFICARRERSYTHLRTVSAEAVSESGPALIKHDSIRQEQVYS